MIQLTQGAQEKVRELLVKQGGPNTVFRVSVKGGGCSGMTYDVKIDTEMREGDKLWVWGEITVVCDPKSLIYLEGMTIDYQDLLVGGGFQFKNPNASGSCGCGTSFAV